MELWTTYTWLRNHVVCTIITVMMVCIFCRMHTKVRAERQSTVAHNPVSQPPSPPTHFEALQALRRQRQDTTAHLRDRLCVALPAPQVVLRRLLVRCAQAASHYTHLIKRTPSSAEEHKNSDAVRFNVTHQPRKHVVSIRRLRDRVGQDCRQAARFIGFCRE